LTAEIELPGGRLTMTADDDSLTLRLTGADEDRFEAAQGAVAKRVDRIAGRDAGVSCAWHRLS
jgi:hypothetical protein